MKYIIIFFTVLTICVNSNSAIGAEYDSLLKTVKVTAIHPEIASLNSELKLNIDNFSTLIQVAKEANKKIVLFINGLPLNGIKVLRKDNDTAELYLHRSDDSKETWATLLKQRDNFFTSKVTLSVGLMGEEPVQSQIEGFELIFIKKLLLSLCLALFAIVLGCFLWLAITSNIIRDSGSNPVSGEITSMKPYSIGRTQMAFWFFLIIAAFPIIWLITGQPSEITASILVLMGISSGTALGATAIDSGKLNNLKDQSLKIDAEKPVIIERITEIEALINQPQSSIEKESLNSELIGLKAKVKEIESLKKINPNLSMGRTSKGFIKDILSDNTGVSFHRFQIFIWTLVLGIIFIVEVISNLHMPEFDDTLLMLMGISSGTYIGFKFPEQQPE